MKSIADSSICKVNDFAFNRWVKDFRRSSTMPRISVWLRAWKIMVSSIRLRNSGRKLDRKVSRTLDRISSYLLSSSTTSKMYCDPRLLVIIMTVFLKSTVRPWESVTRPSSRICSITLNTSGWAFSISSNKITA